MEAERRKRCLRPEVPQFLSRTTAIFATIFLFNSLFLGYLFSNQTKDMSVLDKTPVTETVEKANPVEEKDTDIPLQIKLNRMSQPNVMPMW